MQQTIIIIMLTLLTACVSTPDEATGTINTKDGELGQESYIPYHYVHTNPPNPLLPPPTFIHSKNGEYTYYDANELEAYADALVAYHRYLERYIGSMEGGDGKPIVTIGAGKCLAELSKVTLLKAPPKRPVPPSFSSVEKSEGSSLMVKHLNEIDRWIEDLESHHADTVDEFNLRLRRIKAVCGLD